MGFGSRQAFGFQPGGANEVFYPVGSEGPTNLHPGLEAIDTGRTRYSIRDNQGPGQEEWRTGTKSEYDYERATTTSYGEMGVPEHSVLSAPDESGNRYRRRPKETKAESIWQVRKAGGITATAPAPDPLPPPPTANVPVGYPGTTPRPPATSANPPKPTPMPAPATPAAPKLATVSPQPVVLGSDAAAAGASTGQVFGKSGRRPFVKSKPALATSTAQTKKTKLGG